MLFLLHHIRIHNRRFREKWCRIELSGFFDTILLEYAVHVVFFLYLFCVFFLGISMTQYICHFFIPFFRISSIFLPFSPPNRTIQPLLISHSQFFTESQLLFVPFYIFSRTIPPIWPLSVDGDHPLSCSKISIKELLLLPSFIFSNSSIILQPIPFWVSNPIFTFQYLFLLHENGLKFFCVTFCHLNVFASLYLVNDHSFSGFSILQSSPLSESLRAKSFDLFYSQIDFST